MRSPPRTNTLILTLLPLSEAVLDGLSSFMVTVIWGRAEVTAADLVTKADEDVPHASVLAPWGMALGSSTHDIFDYALYTHTWKRTSRITLESGENNGISAFEERVSILRKINGSMSFTGIIFKKQFKHSPYILIMLLLR